ncbi:MAG: DNA polymerase III subunit alpha [Paludibacteraceae bacterium]|nr:DNA polymerase III subunit alpha [Paludibacteraceae bacterium]
MFTHLHVHSHYSVLDGMSKVQELFDRARELGMTSLALTDHGNMFGIKEFTDIVNKYNGNPDNPPFKAIIGVEAYCARRTLFDKDPNFKVHDYRRDRDVAIDRSGWHLILLAKNKKGYQNLCKIVTQAWVDGFYDRPRIDKNILEAHKEGLIVCSACLGGELPYYILRGQLDEAEKSAQWFKSVFGDDYYIELQRHKTNKPGGDTETYERQSEVNPVLIEIARKYNIKIIASNDVHFVLEKHAEAHERLICISTGAKLIDENRMRYTKQEWLKSPEEMAEIFSDIPEAIENTQEIVDKIEPYSINSDPIMPKFDIPAEFGTEEEYRKRFTEEDLFNEFTRNEKGEVVLSQEAAEKKIVKLGGYEKLYRIKLEADYLAKLAWDGAKMRYGENLSDTIKENITFELHTMKTMGFPGYFLIVMDYIRAAREELDVSVGPGRGSAAGSVVAYCLRITDIDPLRYDLLFERFLNPDRISLPDIDVDFDDDGRAAVLDYVTRKYGKERVAHIITYGTMATKSSIKDVGRIQNIPLPDVNKVVSYVPSKFPEDPKTGKAPAVTVENCIKMVPELQQVRYGGDGNPMSQVLEYAEQLEGTIRQIGIHACGVIIGADDLIKFAPLSTVKDKNTGEDVLVTEYDGHVVESVGLIKMDFLGLSTLSIIKEALHNIKITRGIDLDIDHVPIDDPVTFKLYGEGRTIGTFQFESPGMQKYLRELKPTVFEDLIAMNALYRPGPIEYIPDFIDRKLGRKPIEYDIPVMEKYLKDTYGITVYQEQVMLLSRLLSGFTRGQSDTLRKAMGKKQRKVLDELKPKFINGGVANGHDPQKLEKIWSDWEAFAKYAFNKSHATCYAWVAYQTAYLKANYPAEYMAANLTRNKDDITEVTKFMAECKAMGIKVLGPDVNESYLHFVPNDKGDIRFGLGGIKGVGEGAVEAIVNARQNGGRFKDIYDFFERVNLSACNKKAIECLVYSGSFDNLGITREQLMADTKRGMNMIEVLMHYGNTFQQSKSSMQYSLFGDTVEIQHPALSQVAPWDTLFKLRNEREVIGMYISAHPLDKYKVMLNALGVKPVSILDDRTSLVEKYPEGTRLSFGGIITDVTEKIGSSGKPFITMALEDFWGNGSFILGGKMFKEYRNVFMPNMFVYVTGVMAERYQRKEDRDAGKPKEYSFSVDRIELLDEVRRGISFDINLDIPLESVQTDLIETLGDSFLQQQTADDIPATIYVNVYDKETHSVVNFKGKQNVMLNEKVFDMLQSYVGSEENVSDDTQPADVGSDDDTVAAPMGQTESVLTFSINAR